MECQCPLCRGEWLGRPRRLPGYGLDALTAGRHAHPGLLEATLDLFAGHPVPALYDQRGWSKGWHPAPRTTREEAFRAHLVGAVRAGSYPFLGTGECDCIGEHTCAGLGTTYMVIDVDAHRGEQDAGRVTAAAIGACMGLGIAPFVFASKSGNGAHVFVFLDAPVPTTATATVGKAIRRAIGADGRCDIIPSANHQAGYGTMHALPLHPNDADRGGGLLLTCELKAVRDPDAIVYTMRHANETRSSAETISAAACEPERVVEALRAYFPEGLRCETPLPPPGEVGPLPDGGPLRDGLILRRMRRRHTQFRWALASPAKAWKGGRSGRDAHLARQMARQGMSPKGIAKALTKLPGTKSSETGRADYTSALAAWCPPKAEEMPAWVRQFPPPADVDGVEHPWWRPEIQARLKGRRSKADARVLAFLISFWFWGRGLHPRRPFFMGGRTVASILGLKPRTTSYAIRRLESDFADVIQVTRGVPHPNLRVATAYDVVDVPGASSLTDQAQRSIFTGGGECVRLDVRDPGGAADADDGADAGTAAAGPDVVAEESGQRGSGPILDGRRGLVPHAEGVRPDGRRVVVALPDSDGQQEFWAAVTSGF